MDYVFVYILLLGLVGLFIDYFFRHYVDAKLLRSASGTAV